LVAHAAKIVLKMMQYCLEPKAEAFLGNDQFGFRKVAAHEMALQHCVPYIKEA